MTSLFFAVCLGEAGTPPAIKCEKTRDDGTTRAMASGLSMCAHLNRDERRRLIACLSAIVAELAGVDA